MKCEDEPTIESVVHKIINHQQFTLTDEQFYDNNKKLIEQTLRVKRNEYKKTTEAQDANIKPIRCHHLSIHRGFLCTKCGKWFPYSEELEISYYANIQPESHKATKVIESGYLCPKCGEWFSYSANHKDE